jgi:hypothetical protein
VRDFLHSAEPPPARTPEKPEEKSFHLVICVMSEKDRQAAPATSHFGKEFQSRRTTSRFDRSFAGAQIDAAEFKWQSQLLGQAPNELGIGPTGAPAQTMVEMADD